MRRPKESRSPLGSGADFCLAKGLSESAHSLLLLPRQFYEPSLSDSGLHFLVKANTSKIYVGHSLIQLSFSTPLLANRGCGMIFLGRHIDAHGDS